MTPENGGVTQVLLMTLQNAPPGLDHERDKKFSKVWQLLNNYIRSTQFQPGVFDMFREGCLCSYKSRNCGINMDNILVLYYPITVFSAYNWKFSSNRDLSTK